MSASTAEQASVPKATPPRPVLVRAFVVASVLVALALGTWWWTHPKVFDEGYGTFEVLPRPLADAKEHLGMYGMLANLDTDETITLTGFDVHFSENSAEATGSLALCVPRSRAANTKFGNGVEEIKEFCRELRSVKRGTRMLLDGSRSDYFVLIVTPTRPGSATVDELELSYRRDGRHLFQRGTQHIDELKILTITAR